VVYDKLDVQLSVGAAVSYGILAVAPPRVDAVVPNPEGNRLCARGLLIMLALFGDRGMAAVPPDRIIDAWQKSRLLDVTVAPEGTPEAARFRLLTTPRGEGQIELSPDGGKLMVVSG
jgi:hypothetical protein